MIKDILGDREVIVADHPGEDWTDRILIEGKRDGDNVILNKLEAKESNDGETYIVIGRNIQRPIHGIHDGFSSKKLYTPIKLSADTLGAVVTRVQEKRVADTVLPYEHVVPEFNPESDIHSDNNFLLMDRTVGDIFEEAGYDIDGFASEYEGVESVAPTAYQSNIADDVVVLKRDLRESINRISTLLYYYRRRGEVPSDIVTIRGLLTLQQLPAELDRELADFTATYSKYMELQRAIVGETVGKIQIPQMFVEQLTQAPDEFIDEIIVYGENVITME